MRLGPTVPITVLAVVLAGTTPAALAGPVAGRADGPSSVARLRAGLASCAGTTEAPYDVVLTQDLTDATAELTANCVATIDLNGRSLTVRDIVITSGDALTVASDNLDRRGILTADASQVSGVAGIRTTGALLTVRGGDITSRGGAGAAGIGGAVGGAAGALTVTAANVSAFAGSGGAGIGGGDGGAGGPVTIQNATVTAVGNLGAGIGGGTGGGGGSVTVTAGFVTAEGGAGGAGIGGGPGGNAGSLSMTGGGRVSAQGGDNAGKQGVTSAGAGVGGGTGGSGGPVSVSGGTLLPSGDYSAIGGGWPPGGVGPSPAFGSLLVSGSGEVDLNSAVVLPDSSAGPEVVVRGDGLISRPVGTGFRGDGVTSGQIDNGGRIWLPATEVVGNGVTVSGRFYSVAFDAGAGTPAPASPVTVFARSFADAGPAAPFPVDPSVPGSLFTGWQATLPGGQRITVDSDTDLTAFGLATAGSNGVPIALTATYRSPPTTVAELDDQLSDCDGTTTAPFVVTLDRDLPAVDAEVHVGCVARLDLAGHRLTLSDIVVEPGQQLSVTGHGGRINAYPATDSGRPGITTTDATLVIDDGDLEVHGADRAAAVGGAPGQRGGTVVVNGGGLVAEGGNFGAGIGSGADTPGAGGTAGTVTINGGEVLSASPNYGSAIGGGDHSAGAVVTITGGSVEARSSNGAASIGGGRGGDGGRLDVRNGTVTAGGEVQPTDASAVGAGIATPESGPRSFGSLAVTGAGTLRLTNGPLVVPDSAPGPEIVVGPRATIRGSADQPPTYAVIQGDGTSTGQIQNDGRILMPAEAVSAGGVTVSDRHFVLRFRVPGSASSPAPVTVFGARVVDRVGGQGLPAAPARAGQQFVGWRVDQPAGPQLVTDTTDLTGFGAADGVPGDDGLVVGLVAFYQARPVVTGKAAVGGLLTAHYRGLAGDASPVEVSYTWYRLVTSGSQQQLLEVDHGPTHRVTATDRGARLVVQATVDRPEGQLDADSRSLPTPVVARARFARPPAAAIAISSDRHPAVGQTLRSIVKLPRGSAGVPGLRVTYRWLSGGRLIGTGRTLRVPASLAGGRIQLRIACLAPGYEAARAASPVTRTVVTPRA